MFLRRVVPSAYQGFSYRYCVIPVVQINAHALSCSIGGYVTGGVLHIDDPVLIRFGLRRVHALS